MEAIAFVLGLVALGVLALRFGQDSRERIHSKEHEFAVRGVTGADLATDRGAPASTSSLARRYPTLAFIEPALGASSGVPTAAPDAERLEARARDLTADHWSDAVWTTGVVPETAFRRVLADLAPGLAEAPVLNAERATAGEPVPQPQPTPADDRIPEALPRAAVSGLAGSPALATA